MAPIKKPPLDRFMEKVEKREDGCWYWTGGRMFQGYGVFWMDGTSHRAHRVAYELLVGPIPDGLHIDHLCRNPPCVNPAHLEPVTPSVNINRGRLHEREKTHCPQGHPYDELNTYVDPNGHRHCRTCRRDRNQAEYREKHWKGGTRPERRSQCPKGHPYTPDNTYINPEGHRTCRICKREKAREWWHANGNDWRRRRRN